MKNLILQSLIIHKNHKDYPSNNFVKIKLTHISSSRLQILFVIYCEDSIIFEFKFFHLQKKNYRKNAKELDKKLRLHFIIANLNKMNNFSIILTNGAKWSK